MCGNLKDNILIENLSPERRKKNNRETSPNLKVDLQEFDSVYQNNLSSPSHIKNKTKKRLLLKNEKVFMSQKDKKWKETLTAKIDETLAIEETSHSESGSFESESTEKQKSEESEQPKSESKKHETSEEIKPEESSKVPYNTEKQKEEKAEKQESKMESSEADFIESQIIKNQLPKVKSKEYQKTIEQIIAEGEEIRKRYIQKEKNEKSEAKSKTSKDDHSSSEKSKQEDTEKTTQKELKKESSNSKNNMDESVIRRMEEINDINKDSTELMDIKYPVDQSEIKRRYTADDWPEEFLESNSIEEQVEKEDLDLNENEYELSKSNIMGKEETAQQISKEDRVNILKNLNR